MRLPGSRDARRPADFIAKDDLLARVREALSDLYRYDGELLSIGVNERTICHRLAIYLERRFPYWHVDCEYNRDLGNTKRRDDGRLVLPDIVVHRRMTGENLLAMEIKKLDGDNSDEDESKVTEYLTGRFRYRHGLVLRLGTGNIDAAHYWAADPNCGKREDVTRQLALASEGGSGVASISTRQ